MLDQGVGDRGQPQGCDAAEEGVGDGGAEPRDQAGDRAAQDRAPDAEHTDRPDRDRDRHPHQDAAQEKRQVHRPPGTPGRHIRAFWPWSKASRAARGGQVHTIFAIPVR